MPTTQNISMTDELAAFVSEQVKSGDFSSVSEVYREALRGFRDRVQERKIYMEQLKTELQKGIDDLESGRSTKIETEEAHQAFFENIEQRVFAKAQHVSS